MPEIQLQQFAFTPTEVQLLITLLRKEEIRLQELTINHTEQLVGIRELLDVLARRPELISIQHCGTQTAKFPEIVLDHAESFE